MFRKRTKKPGKNNLRRKRTEEEAEADEDENDVGIAIRNTMKKQKILASLPLTSVGAVPKNKSQEQQQPDPGQSNAELSVLAKKHVRNMEAYIEEKMAATQPKVDTPTEEADTTTTTEINSEEDLYRQLAREVTADAGNNEEPPPQDEGDGGAMLVGTGIAEVILPATAHKPVMSTGRVYNKNTHLLSSAVPEAERHKHVMSKTTPKPFVKFRNNTNSNNNNNNSQSANNNNNESSNRDEAKQEETTAANSSRQGFDAFRGKTPAPDNNEDNKDGSKHTNHRFKTGKDRDDQVYSHFLKNALNGKRR